jgi:hypothetical protein
MEKIAGGKQVKNDMTNNKKEKQSNIKDHSENISFDAVVREGLVSGGIHVNASKGHGKTRLLFSLAQSLRNLEKQHNIDFSKIPLRHWFYGGKIFESPLWKQQGKPFQINKDIKALFMANLKPKETPKPKGKLGEFIETLDFMLTGTPHIKQPTTTATTKLSSEDLEQESNSFFESEEENDLREIEEEFIE